MIIPYQVIFCLELRTSSTTQSKMRRSFMLKLFMLLDLIPVSAQYLQLAISTFCFSKIFWKSELIVVSSMLPKKLNSIGTNSVGFIEMQHHFFQCYITCR